MDSRTLHVQRLHEALDRIAHFRENGPDTRDPDFKQWRQSVPQSLTSLLPSSQYTVRFLRITFHGYTPANYSRHRQGAVSSEDAWERGLAEAETVIRQALQEAEVEGSVQVASANDAQVDDTPKHDSTLATLERLAHRFHLVVRQLTDRHAGRPTIQVNDEYDVQDVLHTCLRIFFDDVREEEATPSYAGQSSRMDFLLKKESVVVECKMTRATLTAKAIGSELIEDIARYQSHPDCETLVCLDYDPSGYIKNPRGVETDLEKLASRLTVKVFIVPR